LEARIDNKPLKNQPFMRYFLLGTLMLVFSGIYCQKTCPKNSILYKFEKNEVPRNFVERLGNHPEFPFLQRENGVNSVAAFMASINDPAKQTKWEREFKAFDLLLRNSGFTNGYKDLKPSSIEKVYVQRGTLGNLGFYDRVKDRINYIYVILSPAGEESFGTAAWKLTNKDGCYFYVLHTCGNAFYPQYDVETECCKSVSVESNVTPLEINPDTVNSKAQVGIRFYKGRITRAEKGSNKAYDTSFQLLKSLDTAVSIKAAELRKYRIYASDDLIKILFGSDSVVRLTKHLLVDSSSLVSNGHPISINLADTTYVREEEESKTSCNNEWEITIDGGMSFNSTPKPIRPVDHTRSNGMSLAAEFSIGKIIKPWFTMGLSASYIIVSYQDDVPYPGSVPGTYNTVYLGKPIIPVQVFAKFSIGKEVGWQSTISVSAGYGIPTNAHVENNGTTLAFDPAVEGGLMAGLKLGVSYYFSCHFGLGATFSGQFFTNQSQVSYSNIFVMPITGGFRFRF
jgi:hypothetical protein